MRDPFGLEPDGQSTKRGSVFSKRNPDDNPDAGITDEVVCEAEGPWSHWWSFMEGSRRGNEWMAGTGAARKGEPTAADRLDIERRRDAQSNWGTQLADRFGQGLNAGGVVYGGAEMLLHEARQNNGAQTIGRALGFGAQRTAQALRGTLGVVSKVGKGLGVAGYGLQVGTTVYKAANNMPIPTAEKVGLGYSTVLVGAAYFAAGTAAAPFVAGAALVYGVGQLGSYMFTGHTLEENYFGK